MESIGERLRKARDKAGLSLGQVYQYEGIQKGHLSEMERGLKSPTAETLIRLARRYHTSADYLLGLEEAGPLVLSAEQAKVLDIWAGLDETQRTLVLDMMGMLRKARTPRIIGGGEEGEEGAP